MALQFGQDLTKKIQEPQAQSAFSLTGDKQSIPQSTVSSPLPTVVNTIPRDFEREARTIEGLGLDYGALANMNPMQLFEMTYTQEELAKLPDYLSVSKMEGAKESLLKTPAPTNTMLSALEDALRTKSDVGRQKLGTSELYQQAGIPGEGVSGYTTLMQSLQSQSGLMQDRYNSFANTLSKTAGAMLDTHNMVKDQYLILKDDYDRISNNMQRVIEQMISQERAMDLLEAQYDLEQKAEEWRNDHPSYSDITNRLQVDLGYDKFDFEQEQYQNQQDFYKGVEAVLGGIEAGSSSADIIAALDAEIARAEDTGIYDTERLKGIVDDVMAGQIQRVPAVQTATVNALGPGVVSGYGSKAWSQGLDYVIQGGKGAPVPTPLSGMVTETRSGQPETKWVAGKTGSFGNYVKIQLDDGNEIQLSHLDSVNVKPGDVIRMGDVIGTQGKTGTTYGITGIHVDATMKKPDGSYYTAKEVQAYLQSTPQLAGDPRLEYEFSPDWFKKAIEEDFMFNSINEIQENIKSRTDIDDDEKIKYIDLFNRTINEPISESGIGLSATTIVRHLKGIARANLGAVSAAYDEIKRFLSGESVGLILSDETWLQRKDRLLEAPAKKEEAKVSRAEVEERNIAERKEIEGILQNPNIAQAFADEEDDDGITYSEKYKDMPIAVAKSYFREYIKGVYKITLSDYQLDLAYRLIFGISNPKQLTE